VTEFRVLGPLQVSDGDRLLGLGIPRQRTVLAALVVDAGRPVRTETLIDRVWGESPPADPRPTLYGYLSRLRRILRTPADGDRPRGVGPVRAAGGYILDAEPDRVDPLRFRRLVAATRGAGGDEVARIGQLRSALHLWRGTPLADLSGQWAARVRETLRLEYLDAVTAWGRAELAHGRPEEVIAPVRQLVAEQPLSEPLVDVLMRALTAAGRDGEALQPPA
jgi:DNA-binding SARP family transcriptional activator